MVFIISILIFLSGFLFGSVNINEVIFFDNIDESYRYTTNSTEIISNLFENATISNIADNISLNTIVYRIEDTIYIKMKAFTNNNLIAEDEVYTKYPLKKEGWLTAISNISERMVIILNGENIEPYVSKEDRELRTKINSLSDNELTDLIEKELSKVESLQLISLMNIGYTYPLNLEISFLEVFKTWSIKKLFHLGIGTTLFKIYPQLPYETNTATTIFPVEIYLPVFISKDLKYNDLIINFEWAWYRNFSTQTNTNQNAPSVTRPISEANYIDLNIRYFLPYSIIKTGLHYNYIRDEILFYIGLEIFIGKYSKD
ncbi:MAG: hypothetical protein ACP5QT_03580 [Brevinematia bacterium]